MKRVRMAGWGAALAVIAALAGLAGRRSWAVSSPFNPTRSTLRGLSGVGVVVEGVSPDVERAGLTRERLLTEIELRLRQAGVKVLETPAERAEAPGAPALTVNLNVLSSSVDEQPPLVFSVLVELKQRCVLERDQAATVMATTWKTGCVFRGGTLRQHAHEAVDAMLDDFLNDYLAVNPKN